VIVTFSGSGSKIVFLAVATVEEFVDLLADIVANDEFASGVLVHVLAYVKDHIVKNHQRLVHLNCGLEFIPAHGLLYWFIQNSRIESPPAINFAHNYGREPECNVSADQTQLYGTVGVPFPDSPITNKSCDHRKLDRECYEVSKVCVTFFDLHQLLRLPIVVYETHHNQNKKAL